MKQRVPKFASVLLVAALPLLSACQGLTESDPPTQARVVVDATPEIPLQLIVSTDFVIILDELTGNQDPQFSSADTIALGAAFDQTYSMASGDARLFVRLANDNDTVEPVHIRVFLDGVNEYDVTANLGMGGFLEYLYRFNQPTIAR